MKGFNIEKVKMLHDRYLIKEDMPEPEIDNESGLTSEVVSAIKTGLLKLPDQGKYFIDKFPYRGVVLSRGPRCKLDVSVGDKVIYARTGGQRIKENDGQSYMILKECDIHGYA